MLLPPPTLPSIKELQVKSTAKATAVLKRDIIRIQWHDSEGWCVQKQVNVEVLPVDSETLPWMHLAEIGAKYRTFPIPVFDSREANPRLGYPRCLP